MKKKAGVSFILNNCHTSWTINFLNLGFDTFLRNKLDKEIIQKYHPDAYLKKNGDKIYIYQNWRLDFFLIFIFLIKKILFPKSNYLWVVFHGSKDRQSENFIRRYIKNSYIFLINLFLKRFQVKYYFISDYVMQSYPLNGSVLPQAIDTEIFSPNNSDKKNKIIVIGNNIKRSHFNIDLIKNFNKEQLVIIGFDNQFFSENGYEVLSANSPHELSNIFNQYSYLLSILKEPENWYNLSTLEAMSCGLTLIANSSEIKRMPSLINVKNIEGENCKFYARRSIDNRKYVIDYHSIEVVKNIYEKEILKTRKL